MVGGHALVRPAVARFDQGDEQLPVLCDLRSRRQARPAHPAPLEPNWVRSVGEALHAEGVSRLQPHLLGHAGGVRRGCTAERTIIS